jgi:FkbH-like protein
MLHVIDVDHAVASVGAASALLPRATEQLVPYTPVGMNAIARTTARHIAALRGARAKCVVVDADNTLWKGVVGEDGLDGLTINDRHRELQEELLDLRSRGILLAIASKNERHDVERVLREHPDCLLNLDDFVATAINWEDKATNLRRIADELNIGIDRFVFVDDNPVECDWVREQLPEVRTVQWPTDLGPDGRLDDLALFDALIVTAEDRDRTSMYRAESARTEAARGALSREDYMRSLAMVAEIGPAEPGTVRRVAQLLQRTNQFNLTTRRHDLAFLQRALDDPDIDIIVLELTDRFGPSGLIGCAIVRYEGGTADIDTLLMSCRVIGRDVERLLVSHVADRARAVGMRELRGQYIASARNAQVEDLYPRLGFSATDEPNVWVRSLEEPFDAPDWIEVRAVTNA